MTVAPYVSCSRSTSFEVGKGKLFSYLLIYRYRYVYCRNNATCLDVSLYSFVWCSCIHNEFSKMPRDYSSDDGIDRIFNRMKEKLKKSQKKHSGGREIRTLGSKNWKCQMMIRLTDNIDQTKICLHEFFQIF